MSVYTSPAIQLTTYADQTTQIYMSTVYALVSSQVFVEYKNPFLNNNNPSSYVLQYITDFGEGDVIYSDPSDKVYYSYKNPGTYYVSYSAVLYSNTDNTTSITPANSLVPFVIEASWKPFNANEIRYAKDLILKFPYNLNQIQIQPNEWGVKDIFNTAITRLQDNLNYLLYNTKTLNTNTPTEYIGWLGNNSNSRGSGIKWNTQTYNPLYLNNASLATTQGSSYFNNLKDSVEILDRIYVLDDTSFRAFYSSAVPTEIKFSNTQQIASLLVNPSSLDSNDSGDTVYISDPLKNIVYKFNIDITNNEINVQLFTGGFGGVADHDKFNSPVQVYYFKENVYVLDYNNKCVKQYNKDLNWIYTYYCDAFESDQPASVTVNPSTSDVYILSESANVYIFKNLNSNPYNSFSALEAKDGTNLNKIIFDDSGDFFYILSVSNIYKYSYINTFINKLNIENNPSINYISINKSTNKSFLITSIHSILKIQDVLETFQLGGGLPYNYWTKEQLLVSEDEFSSDINYNRSLIRMAQNVKTFRDTLNAQMVLVQADIPYISWVPIDVSNQPLLDSDVENETLGVGVNELHVPSVFNKELDKIYTSLSTLLNFLNINNAVPESQCSGKFCWSWKALSTYNITLPVVRTCDMNPTSYKELLGAFPVGYAPSKTWGEAISNCCN
jgi:hypothetical protein